MFFVLGEGGMTATTMIAEGRMDVVAGIGYGMIFACINVIVGMVAGYFCLRYVGLRLNSPAPETGDSLKRFAAKAGFAFFILTLIVLIFSAARVRTLGGHEHIFTFTEVSFLATFNDGLAIIIIVIGLVSSLIAIWKGYITLRWPIFVLAFAIISPVSPHVRVPGGYNCTYIGTHGFMNEDDSSCPLVTLIDTRNRGLW